MSMDMPYRTTDRIRDEDLRKDAEEYIRMHGGGGSSLEDDPSYFKPCLHPEHNPPSLICIPHGKRLRHCCPGCGSTSIIAGPTTLS